MNLNEKITQDLFNSLDFIKGDLNLSYSLRKIIKNKELVGIVNECQKLYRKLIDTYLDTEKYEYDSMIYYSPQYKMYIENNTANIFIFIATPIGKCGVIQITNAINQNTKNIKNKCLT